MIYLLCVILNQFQNSCSWKIQVLEKFQSGFCLYHSTFITALLLSADMGNASIHLLLDMTAAFDTVNHSVLLTQLTDIGLS